MADDLASLRAKIAALRAKTTANGCTEAEALAAAEAVARLMAQRGLDEDDLVMTEAESPDPVFVLQPWHLDLSFAIERCTNTAMLFRQGTGVLFVGREPGPEIAAYLRDITFRAVDGEADRFRGGLIYASRRGAAAKRHAETQFREAMAKRLRVRLLQVFGPTIDLAVQAHAEEVLDRRVPAIVRQAHRAPDLRDSASSTAGDRAGGRVPLHHGVDGSSGTAPPLIEASRKALHVPSTVGRTM